MTCRSSASISVRVRADFRERMREHPQQQRLVRLARSEQPDVRRRRRRQQPAERVERFRADDRPVDAVGIFRRLRIRRSEVRFQRRDPARVRVEGEVQRAD